MELDRQLIELAKKYEDLKKQMKEVKLELNDVLQKIGVDKYVQDKQTGVVYKIVEPTGTFIEFKKIDYTRTKLPDEKKGSLSKKEAMEQGFELNDR